MTLVIGSPLPTLVFVATATLVVAACDVNLSIGDDTTRRTETEVVPRGEVASVTIDTENGKVEVRTGSDDEIRVEAVMDEEQTGDADFSVDTSGSDLAITGSCDAGRFDECRVGFVVELPDDVDVRIRTSNGAIEVAGIEGDLEARTSNGAINAEQLASERTDFRTSNGRVRAEFTSAPRSVEAATSNGAITIAVPDDDTSYVVDTDTNNGKVTIAVDEDDASDNRIDAGSSNGSITIELVDRDEG